MSDKRYHYHDVSRPTRETREAREVTEPQHRETRPRARGSKDSQAQKYAQVIFSFSSASDGRSAPRSDSATRIRSPRASRTDVHNQSQPPVATSPSYEYASPQDPRTRHGPQQATGARNVPATATHGSQGISSASSHPNPLSDLARAFVRIGIRKYDECNDFLLSNPELQMEPREQFQRVALSAIKQKDREYAGRCLQAFVLLRGVNLHGRSQYFQMLAESQEERDAVTDKIRKSYNALAEQAQTQTQVQTGRPDSTNRAGPQSRHAEDTRRRNSNDLDDINVGLTAVAISSDSKGKLRAELGDIPEGLDSEPTANPKTTQQPKRRMSVQKDPNKDPRFKVYPSVFFCPGRVFATVWGSAEGQANSKASDWSRYEGGLYRTTRRMVVVRSRHGSSQCLPVTTYAGKGLSKNGLNDEDVNAHAIIHAEQQAPIYLTNEPRTRKRSIAVAVVQGQTLGKDSRVCFSKIHTVE